MLVVKLKFYSATPLHLLLYKNILNICLFQSDCLYLYKTILDAKTQSI